MQQKQNHVDIEIFDLHISCRKLINLNNLYISDPQILFYKNLGKDHEQEYISKTEIVKHNLNPDFKTTIRVDYDFTKIQKLIFRVIDANESIAGKLTELALNFERKDSWMGTCKVNLAEIIGAKDQVLKLNIKKDEQNQGFMIIYAEKVKENTNPTSITWAWSGRNLKNLEWFSKSDPFAKFYRMANENQKILINQTDVMKSNLNPQWKSWKTTSDQISPNGEKLLVEVWDYNHIGGHALIGNCEISLNDIIYENIKNFVLKDKKKGKQCGELLITKLEVIQPPEIVKEITFLDYLRGSWQLNFSAGIDFTFSNGPINKPDSLHSINADKKILNQYQQTLKTLGGIIISFDYDQQIPLYGFGGSPKLPTYTRSYAEDCFPVNGNKDDPRCNGLQGLLEAYQLAVPLIEFAGPTFIGTILKNTKIQAKINAENNIYTIVLIITDGQIEDMLNIIFCSQYFQNRDEAIKQISECSLLPMSVIIVGVGDENFKYMHTLDDLNQIKKKADPKIVDQIRDITQFVSFKEHNDNVDELCATVLNNFPKQFMEYMQIHNIKPDSNKKVQLSQFQI